MANGQTICQYGTVTINHCTVHDLRQQPVMDPSGTDLKCWKYTVSLSGYIISLGSVYPMLVTSNPSTGFPSNPGAGELYSQAKWRLIPRQNFTLATGCTSSISDVNASIVLVAYPMGGNIANPQQLQSTNPPAGKIGLSAFDVNDGPRCIEFSIKQIAGDNVFRVDAVFEVHKVECDDFGNAVNNTTGVLSHRFSSTDSLDHNLRATRVYRGTLELATAAFSPHWFRYLAVPPLCNGFRRERMDFTASEDGKKLVYMIVDQEIAIAAPPPAKKWSVVHSEMTLPQNGTMVGNGSCTVALEGDSNCDKAQLIVVGLDVICGKLTGQSLTNGNFNGIQINLESLTITDFTGDVNAIQISATASSIPVGENNVFLPRQAGFRNIITADELPAFCSNYNPRQSAGGRFNEIQPYQGPAPLVNIFGCYLQTPCNNTHGITLPSSANQLGADYNLSPVNVFDRTSFSAVTVSNIGETTPGYYSSSMQTARYTYFQCETTYMKNALRAAMPFAPAGYSPIAQDSVAFVTLAPGWAKMRVRILAERLGDWPEFPDPEKMFSTIATVNSSYGYSYPITVRHLKSKLLGGSVTTTLLGQQKYRARFEGMFALSRMPNSGDVLKFGHNPWNADNSGIGTVSDGNLTGSTAWA